MRAGDHEHGDRALERLVGVAEQAERELRRLERQGEQSPESSMIRSYLDWLLAVPWSKRSDEKLDPKHTREVLDEDHAGLDDVKRRITEFISVRKLRQERGVEEESRANGAILTLGLFPSEIDTNRSPLSARKSSRATSAMTWRACPAEIRFSRRSSIHLTARPMRCAASATTSRPTGLAFAMPSSSRTSSATSRSQSNLQCRRRADAGLHGRRSDE